MSIIESQNPAIGKPLSKLQAIKAKRDRFLENMHVDAEIPTWDGLLVARYRPLLQTERDQIAETKGLTLQQQNVAMLTKACIGMYFDGDQIMGEDERPARFDHWTALYLEIDLPDEATDHDICRRVFAAEKNPSALDSHADSLGSWMLNPQMPASTPASD